MAGDILKAINRLKKNIYGISSNRRSEPSKQKLYRFWQDILNTNRVEWEEIKASAKGGPRVLIATTTYNLVAAPIESTLGIALTLRGAEVHYLVCDEFLPTCWKPLSIMYPDLNEFAECGPKDHCPKCFKKAFRMIQSLELNAHRHSEFVTSEEFSEAEKLSQSIDMRMIPEFRLNGIAVGEHAYAGALRFFAKGNLVDEPQSEVILRRFFHAALVTIISGSKILDEIQFDCALLFHGIYVPEGLIGEVARQKKVRVVNWLNAYRNQCFLFSHSDTYHHTMMSEPVALWENVEWNTDVESHLMDYLASRWHGSRDWISFNRNPEIDLNIISRETGVDFTKPCIGMLTNVMWDAQLHYPANIFKNMLEWALQTIDYFAKRPNLQLLIRVHPAELTGYIPSRQPIMEEIKKAYPSLPDNIFIIPPESRISTYAAMLECDSVIIYGTKTGVELTSIGIPVIVAGEAWIKNKDISMDPGSVAEYFTLLEQLPLGKRMNDDKVRRARQYAFHFFFRRMIPLEFITSVTRVHYEVKLDTMEQLKPGNYNGLDVICDGILQGNEFIYPAEGLLRSRPEDKDNVRFSRNKNMGKQAGGTALNSTGEENCESAAGLQGLSPRARSLPIKTKL